LPLHLERLGCRARLRIASTSPSPTSMFCELYPDHPCLYWVRVVYMWWLAARPLEPHLPILCPERLRRARSATSIGGERRGCLAWLTQNFPLHESVATRLPEAPKAPVQWMCWPGVASWNGTHSSVLLSLSFVAIVCRMCSFCSLLLTNTSAHHCGVPRIRISPAYVPGLSDVRYQFNLHFPHVAHL
jgi:hypothetical protein